jgi:hypothetical protein
MMSKVTEEMRNLASTYGVNPDLMDEQMRKMPGELKAAGKARFIVIGRGRQMTDDERRDDLAARYGVHPKYVVLPPEEPTTDEPK